MVEFKLKESQLVGLLAESTYARERNCVGIMVNAEALQALLDDYSTWASIASGEPGSKPTKDGPGSPLRKAAGAAAGLLEYCSEPRAKEAMGILYDAIKGIAPTDPRHTQAFFLEQAANAVQERKLAAEGIPLVEPNQDARIVWQRVAERLGEAERDLRARSMALRAGLEKEDGR